MTIIVTGTPGTGKTYTAKKIASKLKLNYIDVNKIINNNKKLISGYDKKRKTKIVDINKLNKILASIIKKFKSKVVIDSHLSHYLPKKYVDLCVVTRCDLKTLKKRLQKKRFNKSKMRENLDSEIFGICLYEAIANKHKVIIIDTTKGVNDKVIKKGIIQF